MLPIPPNLGEPETTTIDLNIENTCGELEGFECFFFDGAWIEMCVFSHEKCVDMRAK